MADAPKSVLKVFTSLGVEIEPTDDEMANGMCPFCDKARHFYVRHAGKKRLASGRWSAPGHWMCHACQLSGGVPRFLTTLIEFSQPTTTRADRLDLWNKKRIPPAIAKLCCVARSHITGDWLIPTMKLDEKNKAIVSNIHRWWESKNKLLATSTLSLDVMGRQFLPPGSTLPLWIAEGHWDWLILEHLFRSTKQRTAVDIIGVPGSGQFQYEWLPLFENRKSVNLLFDNDHPKTLRSGKTIQSGLDGIKRIAAMVADMENAPITTQYVAWPDDLPDGFDVRDLYVSQTEEKQNAV